MKNSSTPLAYYLAALAILTGCTATGTVDQGNPESVVVGFETKKSKGDVKGAVTFLSPAMLELGAFIGGPGYPSRKIGLEAEAMRKHGGLKSIVILDNRQLSTNERLIRYRMTANDGMVVEPKQHVSLINGKWYIGPAKSQL